MAEYLRKYISRMLATPGYRGTELREVSRELERFDPRDFEATVQVDLLFVRGRIASLIRNPRNQQDADKYLEQLLGVLEGYKGEGTRAVIRKFDFIADADLRRIVERDYADFSLKVFPSGAWKSAVVLAGSILEAILHDVLSESSRAPLANASSDASNKKGPVEHGNWALADLIRVSTDIGVLPSERADTVDQVLRDYRNFVHPKKEIRAKHQCTEAEAFLAKGALDGVCNHLEATIA